MLKKTLSAKGMSLIEVLIATLLFSLALGALLGSISAMVDLIDLAKDKTQAVTDLKNILEKMKVTPYDHLTTNFPNGLTDGPGTNPYSSIVGGFGLKTNTSRSPTPTPTPIRWKSKPP